MKAVRAVRSFRLLSTPDVLWPLVTDTDRFNRMLGVGPIEARANEKKGSSARFVITTRLLGFALEYEEEPFEWSYARSYSVVRRMRGGPVAEYRIAWSFAPAASGADVTLALEVVPRLSILAPLARLEAERVAGRAERLVQAIDAHLRETAPVPLPEPTAPADEVRLRDAGTDLAARGVRAELVGRLVAFLRDAPDAELVRVRPFELADRWGEPRHEVLRAMLHAVPAGLFELRWGVICPSCLTASEQYRELRELRDGGHCQLCDISFELELDRAVEATFFPHPSVRASSEVLFCIGGPARTPHVLSQAIVPRGAGKEVDGPPEPGRYRIFARGGAVASVEVEAGAPPSAEATVEASRVSPVSVRLAPRGAIRVTNATDEDRHVKIERLGFASVAATAHLVSTLEEFRTLFSSDILKPSTPLKVTRVAILFSDLTGSTALYSKVGDAAAFRLVDDHFDVVREALRRHEGVLVKTMGDAVMAAFTDTRRGARAGLDILAGFERFRRAHPHGDLIGIKLGMFAGASYVLTANGQLDYFGQTVNVASRVQHLAESGDLVVAREHADQLPGDDLKGVSRSPPFEARVKGVDAPLVLVRLRLDDPLAHELAGAIAPA